MCVRRSCSKYPWIPYTNTRWSRHRSRSLAQAHQARKCDLSVASRKLPLACSDRRICPDTFLLRSSYLLCLVLTLLDFKLAVLEQEKMNTLWKTLSSIARPHWYMANKMRFKAQCYFTMGICREICQRELGILFRGSSRMRYNTHSSTLIQWLPTKAELNLSWHILPSEQARGSLPLPTDGYHSEAWCTHSCAGVVVTAERRVWDPGVFCN